MLTNGKKITFFFFFSSNREVQAPVGAVRDDKCGVLSSFFFTLYIAVAVFNTYFIAARGHFSANSSDASIDCAV